MPTEHVDVLIIGAGLSGIGAACHLRRDCPNKTFALLEARDAIGGTWDLFRYPGIRSDSDMFTLGYSFKPWEEAKAIADGPAILEYIRDTAREFGVDDHIRFNHRVVKADWSSKEARWTVEAERTATHERVTFICRFLFGCTGYYRYDEGYSPKFEGAERFRGQLIHPQHWPQDLDYAGKRVIVVGSGATAVTLVPAMAQKAAHVTMLQRSPTYIVSLPARDRLADAVRRHLPPKLAYSLIRWKNVRIGQLSYQLSRRAPNVMKGFIRRGLRKNLPADFEIDRHFKPSYQPWDQRLCLVPDADLFKALSEKKASIVTDRIDRFTEKGILLASGKELEADLIVTATGLNLLVLGGLKVSVDGLEVEVSKTVGYKGMMFSGVPNLAIALGYTNASWTLKCDLVSEYVCRLLNHMDARGYKQVTPVAPDPSIPLEPFITLQSGYIRRAEHLLPKQGARPPWRLNQNYKRDVRMIRRGPLEDAGVTFN